MDKTHSYSYFFLLDSLVVLFLVNRNSLLKQTRTEIVFLDEEIIVIELSLADMFLFGVSGKHCAPKVGCLAILRLPLLWKVLKQDITGFQSNDGKSMNIYMWISYNDGTHESCTPKSSKSLSSYVLKAMVLASRPLFTDSLLSVQKNGLPEAGHFAGGPSKKVPAQLRITTSLRPH